MKASAESIPTTETSPAGRPAVCLLGVHVHRRVASDPLAYTYRLVVPMASKHACLFARETSGTARTASYYAILDHRHVSRYAYCALWYVGSPTPRHPKFPTPQAQVSKKKKPPQAAVTQLTGAGWYKPLHARPLVSFSLRSTLPIFSCYSYRIVRVGVTVRSLDSGSKHCLSACPPLSSFATSS